MPAAAQGVRQPPAGQLVPGPAALGHRDHQAAAAQARQVVRNHLPGHPGRVPAVSGALPVAAGYAAIGGVSVLAGAVVAVRVRLSGRARRAGRGRRLVRRFSSPGSPPDNG
jgi:hypothetical protein